MKAKKKNIVREGWAEMITKEMEKTVITENFSTVFFNDDNADWTW